MDFFPAKKQTEEYLRSVFIEKGLAEVVKLHKAQASYEAKRELQQVNWQSAISNDFIIQSDNAHEGRYRKVFDTVRCLTKTKTVLQRFRTFFAYIGLCLIQ